MSRESKGIRMIAESLTSEQFAQLCAHRALRDAVEGLSDLFKTGDLTLSTQRSEVLSALSEFAGSSWCEVQYSGTDVPEAIESIAEEYLDLLYDKCR